MLFDQLIGDRFDLAMELLAQGEFVIYRDVRLHIGRDGSLECAKPSSWQPENMTEERALEDLATVESVLGELKTSAKFSQVISGRAVRLQLTDDYNTDEGIMRGGGDNVVHLTNGKLVWDYKKK